MKRVELVDATAPLSAYARKARREPVVVTLHGRPIVVVRPLTEDEWEDLVVGTHPNFIEIMKRSREQARAGKTRSLAELKRKYVKPNSLRRSTRRPR